MAEDKFYLTERDRQLLRDIKSWWQGGGSGKTRRPVPFKRRNRGGGKGTPGPAGEVDLRIAVTVSSIPAYTSNITGDPNISGPFPDALTGHVIPGEGDGWELIPKYENGQFMWEVVDPTPDPAIKLLNLSAAIIPPKAIVQYYTIMIDDQEANVIHAQDCG